MLRTERVKGLRSKPLMSGWVTDLLSLLNSSSESSGLDPTRWSAFYIVNGSPANLGQANIIIIAIAAVELDLLQVRALLLQPKKDKLYQIGR